MDKSFPGDRLSVPLWLLTALVVVSMSVFGRRLQVAVGGVVDPHWLAFFIFLFLAALLGRRQIGEPQHRLPMAALVVAIMLIAAGGGAVYVGLLQPVEAVHFLLFSWFGWISARAFGFARGGVLVVGVAIGDEILQHFLPDRVGDLRDILINSLSGWVGLMVRGK